MSSVTAHRPGNQPISHIFNTDDAPFSSSMLSQRIKPTASILINDITKSQTVFLNMK